MNNDTIEIDEINKKIVYNNKEIMETEEALKILEAMSLLGVVVAAVGAYDVSRNHSMIIYLINGVIIYSGVVIGLFGVYCSGLMKQSKKDLLNKKKTLLDAKNKLLENNLKNSASLIREK